MRSCEQRRSCERHRRGTSATTGGLSRRDVIVGVVSTVTNWFTPSPPQRQTVELSGGTHHRVDAGSVKWAFDVPQAKRDAGARPPASLR